MNVIITIKGREAIPIRAIPFATGFRVSPDALCEALAHDSPSGLPILVDATAYQLDEYGNPVALWPKDWDEVVSDVAAVSEELDAEGETGWSRNKLWKVRATLAIPAGYFMWLDELSESFRRGVSRRRPDYERKGDREIRRYPTTLPEGLRWEDLMDGFERFIQSPASEPLALADEPARIADPTPNAPPLTAEPASESDAPTPAPVAKPRRKPTKMERLRPKLETIIEALEQYAKDRGDDFSRLEMPGPLGETHKEKGSFHWLCGELEPGFKKMGKDRFWHYRKGICACRHWANDESNFYTQALPVCRHFPGLEKTEQKF